MTPPGVAGVVGLGLMGGSLARDLAVLGWRVQGTDRDPATAAAARAAGVIEGPLEAGALDLLVLAVPVRSAPAWLRGPGRELGQDTVITDLGSTKRSTVEAAEAAGLGTRFVGSHPMAGDHRSGWEAARTGLYRDAAVWITPAEGAAPDAIARVEGVWRALGARPRRIEADDHDRLMARVSHLPQLLATALALALGRAGVGPADLGPGGRDMTRLAGSDPSVWTDILVDNGDQVDLALDALAAELDGLRRASRDLDDATLRALLVAGRAWSRDRREPETAVAGAERL